MKCVELYVFSSVISLLRIMRQRAFHCFSLNPIGNVNHWPMCVSLRNIMYNVLRYIVPCSYRNCDGGRSVTSRIQECLNII